MRDQVSATIVSGTKAQFRPMGPITGLVIKNLEFHEDDRGFLYEVVHNYEMLYMNDQGEALPRFGQVYVVGTPRPGTVRAFHKHRRLVDFFCIVRGRAKFCFVDDRENGIINLGGPYFGVNLDTGRGERLGPAPNPGTTQAVVASGSHPKLITVPAGVFHGWEALEPDTLLVSVGTELYDKKNPDEVRVPPDYFILEFGEDPWAVKGR